jgi:retron-type reverse transcriptase
LFGRFATFAALRRAALTAVRGKRAKLGPAAFMTELETQCLALERELQTRRYRPGPYVEIEIDSPKRRIVSAAPFRDRVVHHALCAQVGPVFERGFIGATFANRTGKGVHRAVETYERRRDRSRFVLRCDIFRYFPAIDHQILQRDFRRRIACPRTLALMDLIVERSNPQEPVEIHFAGDDLLTPLQRRRGLPIGNLTSQLFANLYLDPLDHFCTEVLRAPYLRYVDDFALFADDERTLEDWRARIATFLEGRRLRLHPRKTFIARCDEPARFLGYDLLPDGRRRLPPEGVARFRGRLRSIRDQVRAGTLGEAEARARIAGWEAHAGFAHSRRLRNAILGTKDARGRRPPLG